MLYQRYTREELSPRLPRSQSRIPFAAPKQAHVPAEAVTPTPSSGSRWVSGG